MRRKQRIRKKISGSGERPRLSVFKSDKHISCQLIDDLKQHTLVSASSLEKQFKGQKDIARAAGAARVGTVIAERALAKGIKTVVFDRNGFAYHGRIKAFAEAARQKGLVF
jgi:large subunit ribosomal protein L18